MEAKLDFVEPLLRIPLLKCLAFDAITAWRVFSVARDTPETPAARLADRGRSGDDRGVHREPSVGW